jgi:CBS domain-containing protein
MLLKEIMTPNVETISVDASIQEAARKMATADIGFLPVIDEMRPVGAVTDRDITIRAVADGRDPMHTRVGDVMTLDIVTVSEDADPEDAARLMKERQVHRVLVVGEHDRFVGVVSLGDLATKTGEEELSDETLRRVSQHTANP